MSNFSKLNPYPFRFSTGPGPSQRSFSNQLGKTRLINASKFIARFFPVEWKLCVLTNPEYYLAQANPGGTPDFYQFDETFANLIQNALLRVTRSACCLITNQSPLVEPGSGFSFVTDFPEERLQEIGGFPEYIININLEGPEYNLLQGRYSKHDALLRCRILTRNCQEVILFINRAYNLKGDKHDFEDGWNFAKVLLPANNRKINACIPGAAKVFTPEQWAQIQQEDNTDGEDSNLSSGDDINRPSPAPRAAVSSPAPPAIPEVNPINSPHIPETPAPTPVADSFEKFGIPDLGEFFKDEKAPFAIVNPADTLINGKNSPSVDSVSNSAANSTMETDNFDLDSTSEHLGNPRCYVDKLLDPEAINIYNRYISSHQFTPLINGKPLLEDCPCGLYDHLLEAFTYGKAHDDYLRLNGKDADHPIDIDHKDLEEEEMIDVRKEFKEGQPEVVKSRALIPHPIYGRDAQNALVEYSPHFPNLFLDN